MWIARDKNGLLYEFYKYPTKGIREWITTPPFDTSWDALKPELFPKVLWEDTTPVWKRIILKEWLDE